MKYDLSNQYEQNSARAYFDKLLSDGKRIDLAEVKPARSLSQNSYLHVVITLWAIHHGYKLSEAKDLLKDTCPFMHYEKNGHAFRVETSKQDSKQLTDFIEWIRNYAVTESGLYIPTSEEYLLDRYRIDRDIDNHKKYL